MGIEWEQNLIPVGNLALGLPVLVELRTLKIAEVADIVRRPVDALDAQRRSPATATARRAEKSDRRRSCRRESVSRQRPKLRLNCSCTWSALLGDSASVAARMARPMALAERI